MRIKMFGANFCSFSLSIALAPSLSRLFFCFFCFFFFDFDSLWRHLFAHMYVHFWSNFASRLCVHNKIKYWFFFCASVGRTRRFRLIEFFFVVVDLVSFFHASFSFIRLFLLFFFGFVLGSRSSVQCFFFLPVIFVIYQILGVVIISFDNNVCMCTIFLFKYQ